MNFPLRKGPAGPPAFSGFEPDGTVRTDDEGEFESIAGTAAGQLWFWNGSIWLPTSDAPSNGDSPVWDSANSTWAYSQASPSSLQYFDTTFDPLALYNFNSTLADTSGNGNNLALVAGNGGFSDIVPGKKGLFVWVNARYESVAAVPLLQVTGDLTLQAIVQQDGTPSSNQCICSYGGPLASGLQADNTLYSFNLATVAATSNPRPLLFASESGAGVGASFTSTGSFASLGCIHNVLYIAVTRRSNVIRFYVNGKPLGSASAALTTPNGGNGANTRFTVGSTPSVLPPLNILIFAIKVIGRGLSDAEILSEYNRTMGPAFGVLS